MGGVYKGFTRVGEGLQGVYKGGGVQGLVGFTRSLVGWVGFTTWVGGGLQPGWVGVYNLGGWGFTTWVGGGLQPGWVGVYNLGGWGFTTRVGKGGGGGVYKGTNILYLYALEGGIEHFRKDAN